MSPSEFQEMLVKDAQDFQTNSDITVANTNSNTRTSVTTARYSILINKGDKFGELFADFEIVDLTTHKYINKLIGAGSYSNNVTWYFHPRYYKTVSISGRTAVINYVGYWTNDALGLSENTTDTYTVTFNV